MGAEQSCQKKAPAATQRDIDRALEKQRKVFEQIHEQKIKALIEETKKNEQTTAPGPLASHQPRAVSMEMQNNAHNHPSASLYPNLSAGYYNQGNIAAPGMAGPSGSYYAGPTNLYVPNNSYHSSHQFMPTSAQIYPSAPPSAPNCDNVPTRSRSQSRNRDGGGKRDINCQTCGKTFVDKIYQCNQKHNSCHLCKLRQVPCGQCRHLITARRNMPLEKSVSEKRVQCPNSSDGCSLYIRMADMGIHEKECPFKVMQCPSLGSSCNWSGKLSQLADHFDEMHPLHNQCEVGKEMQITNISYTSHTMHYIRIGNFNFLMHVKVSETEKKIYMLAQLIGTKHSAAKWYYEIHMFKKNEPRRKFQYFDKCTSNIEPIEDIMKSGACAVLPQEYASTFICNGSVTYKCYIKRDEDNASESVATETTTANRPRRNNFKKYVKKNRPVPAN